MNNKILLTIVLVIAVLGVAVWAVTKPTNDSQKPSMMESDSMMQKDEDKIEQDAMMKEEDVEIEKMEGEKMMEDEKMMKKEDGSYKNYSAAVVEEEQAKGQKVVLFFHAPWCPFCRAADSAFQAKLDQIPDGVTILKTDYDSNTELKQKYGVTYQHTFVQIDNDENAVTKWSGGDIDTLVANIK